MALDSAPFQLRRRLELAGGALSVGLRLRLGDAADATRRAVDVRIDADLAERACAEQRIRFTTQARAPQTLAGDPEPSPRTCSRNAVRDAAVQDAVRGVLLQGATEWADG